MLFRNRIQLAMGAAMLAALLGQASLAWTQAPLPAPPKTKRPPAPQTRSAPAPTTSGPAVQLVSPTVDAETPASGSNVRFSPPPDDPIPPPNAQPPRAVGDPTIPSPEVRQMLEAGNANRTNNNNNQPAASPALPVMSIKARIISHKKQPVAVIDVGGTPLTIHLGDTFSIGGGQGASALRLKVVEMNQTEIRFEVENRRQILTLN